jgi:membrane-bound PQQ-dependent dehydrogenase (glucose/quinate/shikimate family)
MKKSRVRYLTFRKLWVAAGLAFALSVPALGDEWPAYGGNPQGTRYSLLRQITPENVAGLKPAWTYHTGDVSDGKNKDSRSGFESTPLIVEGRLYLTTPFNRVIALDPKTGRQLWSYDPNIVRNERYGDGLVNRGLAAWRSPTPLRECALRLFEATLDARLLALDARTGLPCRDFGGGGSVSLRNVANYEPGWYHMTSPPVVLDGAVVVGSAINDGERAEMSSGVVRGYDARTGKLLWKWDPVVRPKGVTRDAWHTGAGNAWSIITADPRRHLIYVPTGSASPDYYGGLRPGDDRWANSVVALHPRTGKMAWGFQLVHHDLWDYDTAAAPLITTLRMNDKAKPVLIAGNKTGMLYVLDPATGKPVLPIEERSVPQSSVPGEETSPTQPFPTTIPPLVRQTFTASEAWGLNDADRRACAREISASTNLSIFTPPDITAGLAIPGNVGGINWSGFAWDAMHQRLIVAVSNLPYRVQLAPAGPSTVETHGEFRGERAPQRGAPYAMTRTPFKSPSGLPCIPPPWGELVAVDLAKGEIAWRTPVGSMDEVWPGIGKTAPGSVMLGGPIVTAGGLIFVGGTSDRRFHALSAETGTEVWSAELPASVHAQPATYSINGKQYVVIAAGGSSVISEEALGDTVIAYALP